METDDRMGPSAHPLGIPLVLGTPSLTEPHSQRLVNQLMRRAQILAGSRRYLHDHAAALLLVFLLVDHQRFEDDGEKNGAEKQAEDSEVGEAPERR